MPRALTLAFLLIASTARAEMLRGEGGSRLHERVTCSVAAALNFGVPTNLMLAVAEMEGGRPGQRVRNRNGSVDVGPMQFNTRYLEHLERRYGITAADVAAAGCYPYELAAWRLRKDLEFDAGDVWTRAANYHSRSLAQNSKCRRKLIAKAAAWERELSVRVRAYEARVPSSGGRVSNDQPRQERRSKRQTDSAEELLPELDDDSADLVLLMESLSDEHRMQPITAQDSGSVGSAHAGSLAGTVQLGGHSGYRIRERSRAWGTSSTIDRLVRAFDQLLAIDPAAPRVRVHDLSLRDGGPMDGHKSHQSGRDVDISYYQYGCRGDCIARRVAPHELDALRQWHLLRYWLEHDQAEFVFIDYALQQPLYEAARASGTPARQLARWFQYPRGIQFPSGIIRHVPGHANHVHVRFRCTQRDRACQGTLTRAHPGHGDLMSPLLELAHDEDESELLGLLSE